MSREERVGPRDALHLPHAAAWSVAWLSEVRACERAAQKVAAPVEHRVHHDDAAVDDQHAHYGADRLAARVRAAASTPRASHAALLAYAAAHLLFFSAIVSTPYYLSLTQRTQR